MAITQQQVSDWFRANPNATPEQVAQVVQSIGGFEKNPELAGLLSQQYGTSSSQIKSVYGDITSREQNAIDKLTTERLNQYRDFVANQTDMYGNPANISYEKYLADNPIERDPRYQLIKNGVFDYKNATQEQSIQAIANISPEVAKAYQTPVGLMKAPTTDGKAANTAAVTAIKEVATVANTKENVDKLASQILAQNTTAKWSGGLPPDKTALYMAADLDKSGITDISQVGQSDKGIINTVTGEKLFSGYGERTKGNLWSGSYEGKGNTGFGVQFTESGKPIFYSEGASSSTLKKDLLKAAVVAAAAFGVFGPESLSSIFGSGAAVGEGLTAAEAFAAGLTPAQAVAAGLSTAELTAAGYTAAQVAAASTAATASTGLLTGNAATTAATAATAANAANAATAATTGLTTAEVANLAKAGLTTAQIASLFSGAATTVGGLLQQQTSKEAADKARVMIEAETAAGKQAAQFKPVGMTTRFGTSQFQVDPKTGQLISAGYTLSPEAKNAQDRFITLAGQGLTQAEQAQAQFAPLQTGAQSLFGLGNKYLAQSPEAVAQNYLNQQMALLQPGRELELANLQNKLQQQGRGGLAVAQGGTLGATTPELQALFNARAQQEALLAANAQKAGQADVLFGSGLLTQGAKTMGDYYAGQQAAYAPYKTAVGEASYLETLAQQPYTLSTNLADKTAAAGSRVAEIGLKGTGQSVVLATGNAATTNPYSRLLTGLASNPAFSTMVGNTIGAPAPITPEQQAIDRYMNTFSS
jgi:hypothetical protein